MAYAPHSSEKLATIIERNVSTKGMSYMEAVLDFCSQRNLEPESVVPLLNAKIKAALGEEGQRLRLLPKSNQLPLE